jgi:hypothetical protein
VWRPDGLGELQLDEFGDLRVFLVVVGVLGGVFAGGVCVPEDAVGVEKQVLLVDGGQGSVDSAFGGWGGVELGSGDAGLRLVFMHVSIF